MNEASKKLGELNIEGNIIPHRWYKEITFENGKPDLVAIVILAEIIYWYRPVTIIDEETGDVIGQRAKFSGHRWQKSFGRLADKFGCSQRQAREACHRLQDAGLIIIEIREKVVTKNGTTIANVTYLEPVVDKVREITLVKSAAPESNTHPQRDAAPSYVPTYDPPTSESMTYTDTPTDIPIETPNKKDKDIPPRRNEQKLMFGAIANVTGLDPIVNRGMIARAAKTLRQAGYTPEQVASLYGKGGWYYKNDWRGKQGQKPNVAVINRTIQEASKHYREPTVINSNASLEAMGV